MAGFRRPESVLVVIHTPRRECLLMERVFPRGFWQSVTGTLRWRETPAAAAVREVREETGLDCVGPDESIQAVRAHRRPGLSGRRVRMLAVAGQPESAGIVPGGSSGQEVPALTATGVTRRFPIRPEWRHRYAPGVTENLEHLWYLEWPEACAVALNADEHTTWRWLELEKAIAKVTSWTNREALERLRTCALKRR